MWLESGGDYDDDNDDDDEEDDDDNGNDDDDDNDHDASWYLLQRLGCAIPQMRSEIAGFLFVVWSISFEQVHNSSLNSRNNKC